LHEILDHGNIRLKIGDGIITDVYELQEIKNYIASEPDQIFLIDQAKIITDDLLSRYLKFLKPKDGIHKRYIDEHGLGDISLREYDDLILYIDKRLEAIENAKPKAHEITTIDEMLEDDTLEALDKV
jgi:hypothetical protein